MNIIIFEDLNTSNLRPFSINHPSFELKCGAYSNLDRIINCFQEDTNYYLIVRDELKDIVQEKYPRCTVNPPLIPEGRYFNGAAVWNQDNINQVKSGYAFSSSGNLVAFNSNEKIKLDNISETISKVSQVTSDINIEYISYLWDCIDILKQTLELDSKVFENNTPHLEKGCILDDSTGPILLGENVTIKSGAIIKGPIFIDQDSVINEGAKMKGNIIECQKRKIGGKISNTK